MILLLGVGLNSMKTVMLEASLGGNKMEGELITTGHTTSFDYNLIWETDKKSIKR